VLLNEQCSRRWQRFWRLAVFRWNRIKPAAAERVTAGQSSQCEPSSPKGTVKPKRPHGIDTAGRVKPTQRRKQRGHKSLVEGDGKHQTFNQQIHGNRFRNRSRNADATVLTLRTKTGNAAVTAADLAISTTSKPLGKFWQVRKASRQRRRTVERTTALPTFFETVSPMRLGT
jgi:hypothetical protein